MIFESKTIDFTNQVQNLPSKSSKKELKSKQIFSKKWTIPENILYARYLKTHISQMVKQKRKKCGKFLKMSNFIGSKSQDQCRSHHQKMLLTLKSIQNIIEYADLIKQKGKLLSVQEFQRFSSSKFKQQVQNSTQHKIQEQNYTPKQSEQKINHQNLQKQLTFQIRNFQNSCQQQSQIVQISEYTKDVQDILSVKIVDQMAQQYAKYFSF